MFDNSLAYAQQLDRSDKLATFRDQFHIPVIDGKSVIYFTGNSLGLQPKRTKAYIEQELNDWAQWGVEGHFHAKHPWMPYHELFPALLAPIVGAQEQELVVMNQLTVNLHLLMVSFYRPTRQRFKIICEAKAFPSDQYALESQLRFHGLDPEQALIEVAPRAGAHIIEEADVLAAIEQHRDELALVMLGGVNYYTGQVFDMATITRAAHAAGAICGFDLAHAAGNIPLQLHNWGVDFACWCSYKYLNSGPGGVSGVFIHEKHIANPALPRFAGWWGYTKETRFQMAKGFTPIPTAEGWQLSNAPILSMAALKASLDIFAEAGFEALVGKSKQLAAYLHATVQHVNGLSSTPSIEVITPDSEARHGCQVSLLMLRDGRKVFDALTNAGVVADWREPNVIRIAPVPLYNRFEDIYQFGQILANTIHS
jgi:kynureninase